jgi:ketosteroid isomerase-like protein
MAKSLFLKAALVLSMILSVSVPAQEPDPGSALSQMVEAERGFAKASVMHGRNAAFVENLTEDCIIFSGRWLGNGRQFFREQQEGPIVLKWEPQFVDISESRDFGVSTGPWEVQEYRPNTTPTMRGCFLTVWKKQADGNWKVILDDGAVMATSEAKEHPFAFPAGADKPVANPKHIDAEAGRKELMDVEKEFLSAWKKSSLSATYASFLAPKARLLRTDDVPVVSPEGVNILLSEIDKTLSWTASGSGAASSGDLGYTYGLFREQGTSGHYVRVWKKQPDGHWKIIIELLNSDGSAE